MIALHQSTNFLISPRFARPSPLGLVQSCYKYVTEGLLVKNVIITFPQLPYFYSCFGHLSANLVELLPISQWETMLTFRKTQLEIPKWTRLSIVYRLRVRLWGQLYFNSQKLGFFSFNLMLRTHLPKIKKWVWSYLIIYNDLIFLVYCSLGAEHAGVKDFAHIEKSEEFRTSHTYILCSWLINYENVRENPQITSNILSTNVFDHVDNLLFFSLKNSLVPFDCSYFCWCVSFVQLFNGSSNCCAYSAAWRHKTELNSCNSYSCSLIRLHNCCLLIDDLLKRHFILQNGLVWTSNNKT